MIEKRILASPLAHLLTREPRQTVTVLLRGEHEPGAGAQMQQPQVWALSPRQSSPEPLGPPTSLPSKAETHASEASQMAVRSWPPSRARTIRPPAKPISCFVRCPKPARGNGRRERRMRVGRGADAWPGIKAPRNALHHIPETLGVGAPEHMTEARSA